MSKAKVLKRDFHKKSDDETEWLLMCPECECTDFKLCSDLNPETDIDWEINRAVCSKCGAIINDSEDNE